MPHPSLPRCSTARRPAVAGTVASLLVAGPAAAQGYGSTSWSIAGTIDGQYQRGTVRQSAMASGSDTTGFACQHAVASYVSTLPVTGSASAVSHNGVLGARASVGVDSVHIPRLGDGFSSFVESTAGYSTHFTAYSAFTDPTYVGPLDAPTTTTTPEPASLALVAAGTAALATVRRRSTIRAAVPA